MTIPNEPSEQLMNDFSFQLDECDEQRKTAKASFDNSIKAIKKKEEEIYKEMEMENIPVDKVKYARKCRKHEKKVQDKLESLDADEKSQLEFFLQNLPPYGEAKPSKKLSKRNKDDDKKDEGETPNPDK